MGRSDARNSGGRKERVSRRKSLGTFAFGKGFAFFHDQAFPFEKRMEARPRKIPAIAVEERFRRNRPIGQCVFFRDFLAVRRPGVVLRNGNDFPFEVATKRLYQKFSGNLGKFYEKRSGGVGTFDGNRQNGKGIPFVHSFAHGHDRYARFRFAFQKGALYRRSAAVFRQNASMHVDAEPFRRNEYFRGENLSIRRDDEVVGPERADRFEKFGVSPNLFRSEYGNPRRARDRFYRTWPIFTGTPHGNVGIRHRENDLRSD